jgi:hypothetical protein
MDKELEEAQDLTRDDLVAKLDHGRPAELARPLDPNQGAEAVVDTVAARGERQRGIALWPEEKPQEVIVLTRDHLAPVAAPIRDPKSRIRAEA